MATSPAPDAAAPPGMCPGIAAKGGGGGNGDGDGNGNGKGDDANGDGKGKGEGASGDDKKGGCAEGDPICPITGRMFLRIYDFGFTGPLPLRFLRSYSSRTANVDGELGFGWSHAFGWRVRVRRQRVEVYDDEARRQVFDTIPAPGESARNAFGWVLSREADGLSLRIQGRLYRFGQDAGGGWHHLTSVADRNGNTIVVQRDARGALVAIIDSAGRPIRFQTDSAGRILLAQIPTEPSHQQWMELARYTYDEEGNLASVTDAEGYTASYFYDRHLMIEHRSVSGLSYCYRYDRRTPDARCLESWGEYLGRPDPALERPIPQRPDGLDTRPVKGINHVKLTYVPEHRYTEVENSLGGVTRYFGDDLGRAVKIVDAAGGVVERAFDPVTGGLAHESDTHGEHRAVDVTDDGGAAGFTEESGKGVFVVAADDGSQITYDERTDGAVQRRYDERGNLLFVRHPDGSVEEYANDARGLVERLVDRAGSVTRFHHDAMGNCIAINWSDGWEASEYDYLGRRISHVNSAGQKTEWTWDRRSDVVRKKHPDGSELRITRDAYRMPVVFDDAGRVTHLQWGGIGWLTHVEEPGGRTWDYRYDTEGNKTYIRNPRGQICRQEFDRAGRCVRVVTFEGIEMRASYNAAGALLWVDTPLGQRAFAHDALDRLESVELPGGGAVKLEYVKNGFRTDNGAVRVERDYDPMRQIVRDEQGAHASRVAWRGGHLSAIVSDVGAPVEYRRDQNDRLSEIQVGETTVRLDRASGTDLLSELGAGLVLRRRFNALGKLERQCLARRDPTLPLEAQATGQEPGASWIGYQYDPAGVVRSEWRSDGTSTEYELDANRQITCRRVMRAGRVVTEEQIRYDAAGSPLLADVAHDALMRPSRYRNEELAYDVSGHLAVRRTDAGDWRYEWTDAGDLARVVAPDHVVEMDYDAEGRRIAKRVYRQRELVRSTSYVWTNNVVLHEVDELSGSTRTYIRRDDQWEAIGHVDVRGGVESRYFYILDATGAIDSVVDEVGAVVWAAERTTFGDYRPTVAQIDVSVRLMNQHADPDVGLVYNRHRWYDPRVGMFVSPDPYLLDGNANLRDYAPNPLLFVDPTGLQAGPSGNAPVPANGQTRPATQPTAATFNPSGTGLLQPGYNATGGGLDKDGNWVPGYAVATGDVRTGSKSFPADIQRQVDAAGKQFGCHSCGAKESGYDRKDHWTADHQPPASQVRTSEKAGAPVGEVRLYPHCKNCSNAQMRQAGRAPDAARITNAATVSGQNTATSGINAPPKP